MKIYVFYNTKDNQIYAITDNKEMRDKFISERDMNLFKLKKISMTKEECNELFHHHSELILTKTILNCDEGDITLACTQLEENSVFHESDDFDLTIENILDDLSNKLQVSDKYQKSIDYLCEISFYTDEPNGTKDSYSMINLFRVFMSMYGHTMKLKK